MVSMTGSVPRGLAEFLCSLLSSSSDTTAEVCSGSITTAEVDADVDAPVTWTLSTIFTPDGLRSIAEGRGGSKADPPNSSMRLGLEGSFSPTATCT